VSGRPSRAEAAAWLMFSAGGMVSALLVPVLLLLFGVLFPLGVLEAPAQDGFAAFLAHPLTRIVLFGLCVLALLHWAHRFRYTLFDGLQLKRWAVPISLLCYGGAAAGSLWAAFVLFG
jgi:succinate dehydrogenase subunit D